MASAKRKTNWFAIWVTIAVVVVLAGVGGLVVWMNNASSDPGPTTAPTGASINQETGAIMVGDGEATVDTYIDFMCPICNQFEQLYGETISGLVDDGTITLNIHPIAILDNQSQGTEFSTRAANAMYCVASSDDGSAAMPFMQAMFENQPEEGTTGLTDEQMLEIAAGVGVTGIDSCVNDGEYSAYVTTMTEKTPVAPGAAGIGTPTVLVNGEYVKLTGDPQADIVARVS